MRWHVQKRVERMDNYFEAMANVCATFGKTKYKKRRDAQAEAARLNKRRPYSGPAIVVCAFRCEVCDHWHIGRNSRRLVVATREAG